MNENNQDVLEGKTVELTDDTFENFIKTHKIVVVDFWAPWCAPCHMISPVLEEVVSKYPGVILAKVNADDNPKASSTYYVMSLPTIIIFKKGEPVENIVGAVPEEVIEEKLRWVTKTL
ncbi:thiol reductase thioredoxin [Sulfolobales archaeon HS-7]|nr:thiol reductase thioredoxin [Sulfolobales archaeon HS-7]